MSQWRSIVAGPSRDKRNGGHNAGRSLVQQAIRCLLHILTVRILGPVCYRVPRVYSLLRPAAMRVRRQDGEKRPSLDARFTAHQMCPSISLPRWPVWPVSIFPLFFLCVCGRVFSVSGCQNRRVTDTEHAQGRARTEHGTLCIPDEPVARDQVQWVRKLPLAAWGARYVLGGAAEQKLGPS